MKKVSVVIPCYGTEKYIEKCIESIFQQSYTNLEIIAVNDCSKGNMSELLDGLAKKDNRLKIVTNEKNKGLFHTRIVGSEIATGDYISFIDSDDYIDPDYFRLLVDMAETKNCDVVLANYVKTNGKEEYIASLSFNTNNAVYDGKEFYDMFFEQTGRNIRNHMLCSKMIDMKIWKSVLKVVSKMKERIVMTEDFAFSSIALYYAKKVGFCDDAIYYYVNNETQSTSKTNVSVGKINKNIHDIRTVFDFVKNFLKEQKVYDKYKEQLKIWRAFYLSMHINLYKSLKDKEKKTKLEFDYENDEGINAFKELSKEDKSWDNYYELKIDYDSGFNKIKEMIMDKNIKIVSFDMFDTLVVRPFYTPSDMFLLLNKEFIKQFNSIKALDFSKIRKQCEADLRGINFAKNIPEVTLDEIYDYMAELYDLDKKKLQKIKEKEREMEYHFCTTRNSGYELYKLAKFMKKKVILTSDIYLDKELLIRILEKNNYKFDEYYVSSELLKTKANGDLFEYIIEKEKTHDILHIGDNHISDYKKPMEYNLKSAQLYKAIDVMMNLTEKDTRFCGTLHKQFSLFNIDHSTYEYNYGVRCALAVVANYYFDNPFRSFHSYSDFNGDPYFIGYYALGMQTIALCKWLLEDAKNNGIDSISYMARDGYLPYEASKIYTSYIKKYNNIKLNYTYVSRKSLMPLLLKDKSGISLIETYLYYYSLTPKDVIKQISGVVKYDNKIEKELSKKIDLNKKFESTQEFNEVLSLIYDKCFDKEKYNNYFNMCKEYFNDNFSGNAATFDVGYSGKPEAIISSVINKPITTYFIHFNNSSAFNNTTNCDSTLKTFYDYKPMLAGTTRELFISSTGPSCVGYEYKNKKVEPVFSKKEKYSYFNKDMINKIQKGALDFVDTFCDYFADYMDLIDLNRYYMSIPLEYYYHYVQMEDRLPTNNLLFEDNVNNYVEMNSFIFTLYDRYSADYSKGMIPKANENLINYQLPKSRVKRIIYYALTDRQELKAKWNIWADKKYDQQLLPRSRVKRLIYYTIFDRATIRNKISDKIKSKR